MKRYLKYGLFGLPVLASLAFIPSIVNAASNSKNKNPSQIPRYTIREERLNAVAQVLNTTPQNLETTLKTETLKQAIQGDGLSKQQFRQKVHSQLVTDLENLGYSQSQISSSLSKKG